VDGTLGDDELDRIATRDALAELEAGRSGVRNYGPHGETTPEDLQDSPIVSVFIESWAPPPQMWIFGAVDFTAALAKVAKVLGYRVTVCDAREVFATRRRFPMADEVLVTWPGTVFEQRGHRLGPRDAVCILTHDPKFDVPAVQGALATEVGYIGVMGSRRTHATRLERLAEVGIDRPEQLARLMAPIGLDLGSRTPEETAISVCAESSPAAPATPWAHCATPPGRSTPDGAPGDDRAAAPGGRPAGRGWRQPLRWAGAQAGGRSRRPARVDVGP
jgi:xanthine dehydrogenase accessory factor